MATSHTWSSSPVEHLPTRAGQTHTPWTLSGSQIWRFWLLQFDCRVIAAGGRKYLLQFKSSWANEHIKIWRRGTSHGGEYVCGFLEFHTDGESHGVGTEKSIMPGDKTMMLVIVEECNAQHAALGQSKLENLDRGRNAYGSPLTRWTSLQNTNN
jgi:hypothetical protein